METGGANTKDREDVLARIRHILDSSDGRRAQAGRVAELIRLSGNYRWVGIYDVDDREVANVAWSGPGAPAHPRFSISMGLSGEAVATRRTVVCNDVLNDPRYLTAFGSTRSEIIVPVVAQTGRVVGTLDVEDSRENAFTDADRRFLEQCALALASFWGA